MKQPTLLLPLMTAAFASAAIPSESCAQEANILRVAVSDAYAWLRQDTTRAWPTIEIDPRILDTSGPFPVATDRLHEASALESAFNPGVAVVMSLEQALACSGTDQRNCRQRGVFAAVTFTVPVVNGDSAMVDAFVRTSITPTAADSAIVRQARDTVAAFRRLGNEAGSATLFRYAFVRRNGSWILVNRTILGQT